MAPRDPSVFGARAVVLALRKRGVSSSELAEETGLSTWWARQILARLEEVDLLSRRRLPRRGTGRNVDRVRYYVRGPHEIQTG